MQNLTLPTDILRLIADELIDRRDLTSLHALTLTDRFFANYIGRSRDYIADRCRRAVATHSYNTTTQSWVLTEQLPNGLRHGYCREIECNAVLRSDLVALRYTYWHFGERRREEAHTFNLYSITFATRAWQKGLEHGLWIVDELMPQQDRRLEMHTIMESGIAVASLVVKHDVCAPIDKMQLFETDGWDAAWQEITAQLDTSGPASAPLFWDDWDCDY